MVTLFTSPSCTSCRKAKAWLQEHDIPYTERNIFSEHLTIDEIKQILKMTEDGTDEIISTRSKTYQKLNVDIDSLPLQDLSQSFKIILAYYVVQLFQIINDYKLVIMRTKNINVLYLEKFVHFQLQEAQRMVD
ncbi:transcriptional regulator Spx [Staphylococcus aureus]